MGVGRTLVFATIAVLSVCQADKSVLVSLNTKWSSTSLLAESSEFIAKESNELFWKFTSDVVDAQTNNWSNVSAEKKYDLALRNAVSSLSESATDLLKLSLAFRAFSPLVQSFQQIGSEYKNLECSAFYDVHGVTGCDADKLSQLVANTDPETAPTLLSVDHVFPRGKDAKKVVIVYGELGSPEFRELHNAAKALARNGGARYVFRHFLKNPSDDERVSLSGYGVELAIKNTEYKAEDDSKKKDEVQEDEEDLHGFNFKLLKQLHSDSRDQLDAFRMHLKEIEELAPLKQWQVQDLSFQAAQRVMNSESDTAIAMLRELSQNFPLYARSIANEQVTKELRYEIEENQKEVLQDLGIDPGDTSLYINGISVEVDSLDMFQVLDTLKQEEKLSTGFFNLGIGKEYLKLLGSIEFSEEKASYAVDFRDAYPFYLNNLDTDRQYKQWGNSVKLMLQPYYPGMIRPIARNLFNLIFIVDPAKRESWPLMKTAVAFYNHELPIRIGVIFSVNPDEAVSGKTDFGVAVLNVFNYVLAENDVPTALKQVNKLLEMFKTREQLDETDVHKWFTANYGEDIDEVFGAQSDYNKGREDGAAFMNRAGLSAAPQVLLNGFVLEEDGIKGDKFEETVMLEVMRITPKIQKAVMSGELKDKTNVGNWIMSQKGVMPRLNKRVLDAATDGHYLDLSDLTDCTATQVSQFNALTSEKKAACIIKKAKYFKKSDDDVTTPATMYVIADFETAEGRELAYNAMKHLKHSRFARVAFIANPSDVAAVGKSNSITSLFYAAVRLLPQNQGKQFVTKLVKEEFAAKLITGELKLEDLAVGGMNLEHFNKEKALLTKDKLEMDANFATTAVGLKPGDRAVVANGLVIGALNATEAFNEADFGLVEKMLESKGSEMIAGHIERWGIERTNGVSADLVLRSWNLISKNAVARKRTVISLPSEKYSKIEIAADDTKRARLQIVAVVDPLSRSAQKLAPILELLRNSLNADVSIYMNPKPKLSELPLKRLFRYVATAEVQFDPQGRISPNQARFTNLPSKQLLTLSLHAPDAWMVENVFAEYDLDNIKMEQVTDDVVALFSLEQILLEGHCFDEVTGSPPRGLQFILGTQSNPATYDTIVMANLGYFQLKASPGSWLLRLRDGRSNEIYKIGTHTNTEGMEGEALRVMIDSFSGRTVRVRVQKREGMEKKELLTDDEEGGSIWNSVSNAFTGEKHETINVFSLASGHLYERFMRIMILSVMKNTKHPVKFWLLKNYLSPQFKESLPLLKAEYGFEYELVEYKWPRWLHQQKEKQRIMWGYKILFLDVLFPLDVQKIIFVDADQVVRADLMELMEFDLGGAPYGYVPFCESRKEMDGFRFWKQGYWANHLAGRRYHISALYVIDLQKFRQVAAGDRLRGQYQGLSSDPNSLANLDQDLPNNMIHQVKIKSLPQEWLWCETWCDDGSKPSAKTIDLCNNPLTKEPKLNSASRIISEWNSYDKEIKDVISRRRGGFEDKKPSAAGEDHHTEL